MEKINLLNLEKLSLKEKSSIRGGEELEECCGCGCPNRFESPPISIAENAQANYNLGYSSSIGNEDDEACGTPPDGIVWNSDCSEA